MGGSKEGATISNADGSLACSLSWSLIGAFDNNELTTKQGEIIFKITNHGRKSQKFALAEYMILDKGGKVLFTSNPFRELQGELLYFDPPLESGQNRKVKRIWKYQKGWNKVELKTCRWLESDSQYDEIYPELKDLFMP